MEWVLGVTAIVSAITYFVGDDDDKRHALMILAFAAIAFLFWVFY